MVDPVPLLVTFGFGGTLLVLGVALVREGYRRRTTAARIADSESVPAGEITREHDQVVVEGTARPAGDGTLDPAIAPDSEAVVVHTEVGRYSAPSSTSSYRSYQYRQETTRTAPFVVADDTGEVLVDPDEGVDVETDDASFTDVEDGGDPPPDVATYLDAHDDVIVAGSTPYRFRQRVVRPGQTVVVAGRPREAPGWDTPDFLIGGDDVALVSTCPGEAVASDRAVSGLVLYLIGFWMIVGSAFTAGLLVFGG